MSRPPRPLAASAVLFVALAAAGGQAAPAGIAIRAPIEVPRLPAEFAPAPKAFEPPPVRPTPFDRIQPQTLVPPRPAWAVPADDRSLHSPAAVGFIVSTDGVVLAPHLLISRCSRIEAELPQGRAAAGVVATEGDVVILRIGGGPYVPLPPSPLASRQSQPVTMLGSNPARWRVAAGDLLPPGSNRDDAGWPQVRTLPQVGVASGPVWAQDGGIVGIAIAIAGAGVSVDRGLLRLIPAGTLQQMLASHGIGWNLPLNAPRLDTDAAMRRALGATVRLACA